MKQLTVLFLQNKNQVLLAMKKRGFGAGRWNGVGGKLEPNETISQAMIRECQEEIGVTPKIFSKRAEVIFNENHQGTRELLHVHVFIAEKWEGDPIESDEMAPRWFTIDEIPYDNMWADDPYWLPQVLAGKQLKCMFTLDDSDKVIEAEVIEVTELASV